MRVAPLLSRLTTSPLAMCPRRGRAALRALHDWDWDPGEEIPVPEEPAPGVIPIHGVLVHRGLGLGPEIDAWCGLVAYDELVRQLEAALADPQVSAIVLDVDSPGGEIAGLFDAADAIRAARAKKPVIAVANECACSAAYTLAAAAGEVIATQTAALGSIGVVYAHEDLSGFLAQHGFRVEFIFAGEKKIDGNGAQPLSTRARADLQAEVDEAYRQLVESIGASRPALGPKGASATEAGVYCGQAAVEAGLADKLGTLASAQARAAELAKPKTTTPGAGFGHRQTFRRSA